MSKIAGPAQPLDGEAPEWVHLLPPGRFSGDDGRGPYSVDAASLVAAFKARAKPRPLVIDFTHQCQIASNSDPHFAPNRDPYAMRNSDAERLSF